MKVLPQSSSDMRRKLASSRGGKLGGKNRMESLSPEERKALAQKAAAARWSKTLHVEASKKEATSR